MTLDLPVPPTVNHAYATVRGRRVLSAEGRRYKEAVRQRCILAKLKPIREPVVLTIVWRRERKSGDLTNRVKLVEDALKGFAWIDDCQVVEAHLYRQDDRDNAGVTVTVERAA